MKTGRNALFILGSGECGQLPPEHCDDYIQLNPKVIDDLPNEIDEVICGSMHTIIKTKDDKLYSFGCNDMGALGRKTNNSSNSEDTTDTETTPKPEIEIEPEHSPTLIKFTFESKIKKITCGDNHTAILLENGQVYITGGFRDGCGTLGIPSFKKKNDVLHKSDEFIKIDFSFTKNVKNVLLLDDGNNTLVNGVKEDTYNNNKLDDNLEVEDFVINSNGIITYKNKDVKIIDIVSGEDHLICLHENKEYIFALGNSDSCQVCNKFYEQKDSEENRLKYLYPHCYHYTKHFNFDNKIENIFCGGNNTFVQLENSLDLYGIGRNAYGACGVSIEENIIKCFTKINNLCNKRIKQLCGGQSFTVCLLQNNDLYIWGNRDILGMGNNNKDAYEPLELTFFKKNNLIIKKISCGTDHCLILTENNKLFAWGTGGNFFEKNTCIQAIEGNLPSEMDYASYVYKTFIKTSNNLNSTFINKQIKIISFAGGSSHCAFISSIMDADKVTPGTKRELQQTAMYNNKHNLNTKRQKLENNQNDATKEQNTFIQIDSEQNHSNDQINKEKRKSNKMKSYLNNETPTRTQPKRSCKPQMTLNENAFKQFYHIVETPITKRRRKTVPAPLSKSSSVINTNKEKGIDKNKGKGKATEKGKVAEKGKAKEKGKSTEKDNDKDKGTDKSKGTEKGKVAEK
uniref:RCC1-like domain-containing protein n=1 Tax=Piliocolobus tephrosceles TaxID=591936 RepID=A0A8C9GMK0_9PRIM